MAIRQVTPPPPHRGLAPPIDSAVGGVLSLQSDVQPPQHVGDEFLNVLMAAVGEGDASALSVGRAGAAVMILSVLMTMG